MTLEKELEKLRISLQQAENIQTELDRRVYYLRTLYDVSKDIFASVDYDTILKNFLLMTMGNFGVSEGFILTLDSSLQKIDGFSSIGFQKEDEKLVCDNGKQIILCFDADKAVQNVSDLKNRGLIPLSMAFAVPFKIGLDCSGLIGLGSKLIGEPYNKDDEELLDTLINNLIIALKNAKSFQEIKSLNKNLKDKNIQLETALNQLQQSMRKVEILESVKENLSKFVPVTVSRMIEKSPIGGVPDRKKQDISVLFADIEGYTKLCEKLGSRETGEIIEKHFSAFMDAIYVNNGDVNETAGDGLMVLFLNEDEETNAIEAVRAAQAIREKTISIFEDCSALYRPLKINMGINSGIALVGAAKYETYSGSRWTYTATGNLTNIAARIGAKATDGSIFLSAATAGRVKNNFSLEYTGKFNLKNVSKKIEIFKL
ncbi:MAG: adenylate/guanylate cyclase domain-containing protein [Deltaproteobacteria bacterium]|jgi:class 3 adenylate cyclase|nr:adenylate/guanylate cyclase domain-containing protein [Deltaproteobacteria bacterium]